MWDAVNVIISIILAAGSGIGVYVSLNNRVIKTEVKGETFEQDISELKTALEKLDKATQEDLKGVNKIYVQGTLALQENTLAIQELRRYLQRLDETLKKLEDQKKHN